MSATYDQEPLKLTADYKRALREFMKAHCKMMRINEPQYADCWTWGKATVGDLANKDGLAFEFGGDEDKPKGRGRWIIKEK